MQKNNSYQFAQMKGKEKAMIFPYIILTSLMMGVATSFVRSNFFAVSPEPPTNLEVIDISFDYVLLTWSDNSDNEAMFIIERHIEGDAFEAYDTVMANASSYIDYRVQPSTYYYYRVLAYNTDGYSTSSNVVTCRTLSLPNSIPLQPLNLNGYFANNSFVLLSWEDNSDNESHFYLFRGENVLDIEPFDTIQNNTTLYADYAIQPNTLYHYYITAGNDHGMSVPSDTVSVAVGDMEITDSTKLKVQYTTARSICISWNKSSFLNQRYAVNRIYNDEGIIIADELTDTIFVDTTVIPNSRYIYSIISYDRSGNLIPSTMVEGKTQPWFTENRINDSLIVLYLFTDHDSKYIADLSWHEYPINLSIKDTFAINSLNSNSLFITNGNTVNSKMGEAAKIIRDCDYTDEISIELWLKSTESKTLKEATIFTLGNVPGSAFSIGIEYDNTKAKYFSNLTTRTTDNLGNPRFSMKEPAEINILQHFVFIHRKEGDEVLYLNGKDVAEGFRPSGFENWVNDYQLIFGNNSIGNSPWTGALYLCAIYNRALTSDEIYTNYIASPFIEQGYTLNPTEIGIKISPNPSQTEITVLLESFDSIFDISDNYYLSIVDINGLLLIERDISFEIGNGIPLDITWLKKGIYTIIISNRRNLIAAKKFLKQ